MNVGKVRVIVGREYSAAVRSKSFVIGVVLMPLLMGIALFAHKLSERMGDSSTYRVAVVDRTEGGGLYRVIEEAVERHNESIFDDRGRQVRGKFALERVEAVEAGDDEAAMDALRLKLSDRVRGGELLAFVEIGPEVLNASERENDGTIRYSTARPVYQDFYHLLRYSLPPVVVQRRLERAGADYDRLKPLLTAPSVVQRGLTESRDGAIRQQSEAGQTAMVFVPLGMIALIFMVTLTGVTPMAGNVVEEKQMRITEVLLGGVGPFELMLGKLLGGVGVALTLGAIYVAGGYYVVHSLGLAEYVTVNVIVWFFLFTVVATLMYGSLFVAAGSACSNMKEVQSYISPVMLLIMLPMMMIGVVVRNPDGTLAAGLSYFPLSAPMVMLVRLGTPSGVAWWELAVAMAGSLATTVGLVWVAGRIFRVGILMQGKGANYAAVLRWVLRG